MIKTEKLPLDFLAKYCTVEGRTAGLYHRKKDGVCRVYAIFSDDGGRSFTPSEELFSLPPVGEYLYLEAAAQSGSDLVHLFFLNDGDTIEQQMKRRGEGDRPMLAELQGLRLNIWHCAYDFSARAVKIPPRQVWEGYCGSLNSCLVTNSGRILLPFSHMTDRTWRRRGDGVSHFSFYGGYSSAVLYSDDGVDFQVSNSLVVPVPDIVSAYGAVEPVCLELEPDRIWMLIRTQLGVFFESFSTDGAVWSEPRPTKLISSDSPAGLVRTSSGEIVLLLNSCRNYPYAHGGRQVLHAAVSDDNGKNFRGFTEIMADPFVEQPPPAEGDFGTGYPYAFALPDGSVLFSTGQGEGRVQNRRLLPRDITAASRRLLLDGAHTFGSSIVKGREELVLTPGSGSAVLNFCGRQQGMAEIELFCEEADGFSVLLTDAFSVPFDVMDGLTCCAEAMLSSTGTGSVTLRIGFDFEKPELRVSPGMARLRRLPAYGVNYLRLRSPRRGTVRVRAAHLLP